ncbi:hypothetical protein Godav_024766, partial [Gossypium davidsonii]|nr:hypothetical protein [Gossypium davidsonii]MBA0668332.1 hypothetical protein [Gossypium klotzschianum]
MSDVIETGKLNLHVLRESNKVVDCLAKTAGDGMNQLVVLVDPLSH